jgi:serine kinase of HPr protein (carbohydrate metabolism regulator)
MTYHMTCVAFDGAAVLFRGPSGAGKSDLALRAIDAGWTLVSDDRVVLTREGSRLLASAPPSLAGLIEVRGLGLVAAPSVSRVPVALVVDLVAPAAIERMPEPSLIEIDGVQVPRFDLAPFESSALAKLKLMLTAAARRVGLAPGDAAVQSVQLQ